MNIFSCRIKKENTGLNKPNEVDGDDADDTIESTHLDSDYAKSPVFSSDVYGSRPNVYIPTGIYSNKVIYYATK